MDNTEVLGHLLKIESEAALLVDEAQAEADKRIAEAERQNRAAYDERYRMEFERLENELLKSKELARQHYREELDAYIEKISSVNADTGRFSILLDKYISEDL
jgi:vacuolar-type H+-ATPase subunit H